MNYFILAMAVFICLSGLADLSLGIWVKLAPQHSLVQNGGSFGKFKGIAFSDPALAKWELDGAPVAYYEVSLEILGSQSINGNRGPNFTKWEQIRLFKRSNIFMIQDEFAKAVVETKDVKFDLRENVFEPRLFSEIKRKEMLELLVSRLASVNASAMIKAISSADEFDGWRITERYIHEGDKLNVYGYLDSGTEGKIHAQKPYPFFVSYREDSASYYPNGDGYFTFFLGAFMITLFLTILK